MISALADIRLRRYIKKTYQGHGEWSLKIAMANPKATGMQELPVYTDLHLESYGNLRFSRQVEQQVFSKQTERFMTQFDRTTSTELSGLD